MVVLGKPLTSSHSHGDDAASTEWRPTGYASRRPTDATTATAPDQLPRDSQCEVGRRLGLGKETVRRWAVQADIDAGARPGVSTDEAAEIKRLKAENRRLTEDLEIMRRASIFFAGELDPRNR